MRFNYLGAKGSTICDPLDLYYQTWNPTHCSQTSVTSKVPLQRNVRQKFTPTWEGESERSSFWQWLPLGCGYETGLIAATWDGWNRNWKTQSKRSTKRRRVDELDLGQISERGNRPDRDANTVESGNCKWRAPHTTPTGYFCWVGKSNDLNTLDEMQKIGKFGEMWRV